MRTAGGTQAGSPDCVEQSLPPNATAPAAARSLVRSVLLRWDMPSLIDAAVLASSELATNALLHGRPPFRLRLRRGAADIRIDVHDSGAATPRTPPPLVDAAAESGRGLGIVSDLATETGVESVAGDGKWVYATFARPALI